MKIDYKIFKCSNISRYGPKNKMSENKLSVPFAYLKQVSDNIFFFSRISWDVEGLERLIKKETKIVYFWRKIFNHQLRIPSGNSMENQFNIILEEIRFHLCIIKLGSRVQQPVTIDTRIEWYFQSHAFTLKTISIHFLSALTVIYFKTKI